jgi:oligopeptide transport system permease protein
MLQLVVRRLLIAIPTMLVIITAAFFLIHAAPGGPFDSEKQVSPEIKKRIEAAYRLDRPVHEQWLYYMGDLAQGDLGPSMKYKDKSVADIIAEGAPTSLLLGSSAMAIAILVGVTLGAYSAVKQNKPQDYLAMGIALIGVCVPGLVLGPLLQLVFGVNLNWLPTAGLARDQYALQYLVLPVLTLALPQIAIISRLTRASMIEALRSNAIRTARAKGLPEAQVVMRHALPVAILPVVAYLGPAIAGVLTGGLIVETVFALPGIGRQFTVAALNRDYPLVLGVAILYAALIILLNLAADMLGRTLDPRARTA